MSSIEYYREIVRAQLPIPHMIKKVLIKEHIKNNLTKDRQNIEKDVRDMFGMSETSTRILTGSVLYEISKEDK